MTDYSDEVPENLYITLENTAERYPDKRALIEVDRTLTYSEFKTLVDAFSEVLYTRYKIRRGDRAALLMVNSIDFCVSFYALARLGAVVVPLSTKSKQMELGRLLSDSAARVLILNEKWWENVRGVISETNVESCIISGSFTDSDIGMCIEELLAGSNNKLEELPHIIPEDPVVLIYTSGTTGVPKGAVLTNKNILHGVLSYKDILGLTADDSTVIAVPIFHITGLAALMALFIYIGGTLVFEPYFVAEKIIDIIDEYKISFFHASPTVYIMLLEEMERAGRSVELKKAACGSANMPPQVLDKLKKVIPGLDFRTVYGLTETSSPATIMPEDVHKTGKTGSSGKAIPGFEMKVVDENGSVLPANEVGELLVKGPNVLKGYRDEKQNREAFADGWFKTGDYARIDTEGFLYIVDRKKDMINRGGEKIYSIEVENVIYSHSAVKEVALIGVPDTVYGEVAKAVISLNKGFSMTAEEVKAWVASRLAKFKVPQYVQFIDEMPHTNNGKISKTMIKSLYSNY